MNRQDFEKLSLSDQVEMYKSFCLRHHLKENNAKSLKYFIDYVCLSRDVE